MNDPEKSKLTITAATAPWSGGTISVKDVAVTLSGKQAIKVNLIVEHVSIDELMQLLTSKRASATGVVSGTLPITIAPDGTITVQEGKLQAEKPGTITMQPDAIPGDNAQVSLVRDVLKDLHYSLLSISADSGKDNKLSVLMTVEGNNPQVYKGKPVKLNVHLTGDVLDFIRQSVASFTNPKMLLKQDENEKK